MIHGIIESACNHGADTIATPWPSRQVNVEIYQYEINLEFGSYFSMPVVYYCQLFSMA